MRCGVIQVGAYGPMRCGAYGPMRVLVQTMTQLYESLPMRCGAYGTMRLDQRTKNGAISHPRLNESVGIREYSNSGQI